MSFSRLIFLWHKWEFWLDGGVRRNARGSPNIVNSWKKGQRSRCEYPNLDSMKQPAICFKNHLWEAKKLFKWNIRPENGGKVKGLRISVETIHWITLSCELRKPLKHTKSYHLFHFLANICQHRGACTWIIFTQNNCVALDVCAFQYNHGSSVTAVLTIGSTTSNTMYPSIDLLHWSVVRICEQHNQPLSYFIVLRILNHKPILLWSHSLRVYLREKKRSICSYLCPWIIYICVPNCVCELPGLRRLISFVYLSLTPKSFSISQVSADLSHLLRPPLKAEAK